MTALEQKKQNARMAILAGLGNQANAWVKRWERLQGRLRKTPGEFADWFGGANEGGLLISGNCEGALMFGAAEPTLSANDVLNLATRLVSHSQGEARADCLLGHTSFSHPIPGIESNWSEGYQLARAWSELSELKPNDEGFVDVESHLRDRGVEVGDIELQDEAIGGVAVARPDRGALVLVNTRNPRNNFPSGRRFTLAHELCHLLHDRSDGQALALISGPWAPRDLERRANAFAAMLLMPDALVEDAFSSTEGKINNPDWQQLVAVAQQIQVSPDALAHHMSNRGWITTGQRRILLEQSGDE